MSSENTANTLVPTPGPTGRIESQVDSRCTNQSQSERIVIIDMLRGLCLVLMTVNHLPHTLLNKVTWEPLGFISAAEGFVFLSGLVTGFVYGRTAIEQGLPALNTRVWARIRVITFTYAIFASISILAASKGLADLGDHARPSWGLWAQSMTFVVAPGFAEILRLYVGLFLFIPIIIWALMKQKSGIVIGGSAALWTLSAFGYGFSALPEKYGYFDLLSWQLLFILGLCLAFPLNNFVRRISASPELILFAGLTLLIFFGLRHLRAFTGSEISPYLIWLKEFRRTISAGRLINFLALSYLIFVSRKRLAPFRNTFAGAWLAFLGKHSLQVFAWSISLSIFVWAAYDRWHPATIWLVLIQVTVVASCSLPAWFHREWQLVQKAKREGATLLPSPQLET